MKQIKKSNVFLVIVLIVLIFVLIVINNKEDEQILDVQINKVMLLNNYNEFFTVNSSVFKYISYLQKKDYNNVLKILDVDYKNNNNINSNNILNYVENLEGNYSFSSKKIYYEIIDENFTKYYVFGYLSMDTIDGISEKLDRYYIVKFNTKEKIFSIIPSNEFDFMEVTNEKN